MDIGGILLGLLYVLLYIAIIILVAFAIRWVIIFAVGAIDPNVDKWGRIVVGLLCAIVVVAWLTDDNDMASRALASRPPPVLPKKANSVRMEPRPAKR